MFISKIPIFNTTQQQSQEHKKVLITGQAKLTLSTMQSNALVLVNIHSMILLIVCFSILQSDIISLTSLKITSVFCYYVLVFRKNEIILPQQ